MRMNQPVRVIRIVVPVLCCAVFGWWLSKQDSILSLGTLSALLSAGLFALTLTAALSRLAEGRFDGGLPSCSAQDTPRQRLGAWSLLVGFGVAVTLGQYVVVYLLSYPHGDFLHSFHLLYYRSDVAHYMGIARHWYVNAGDERLRLVFLPLYPLAVQLTTWHGDYFTGALMAAQVFSLALLPAAYELFRVDLDRRSAMACALLLFLLPGAAFLRVPMSESLFLFLTLLGVLFARKKRFLLAGLFTALSALTRSLGVLLLGLLFLEMLSSFLDEYRKDKQAALRLVPGYIASLLLGCCGTAFYLFINWQVSGHPLTFLTYQRENWNQQLGFFFNTASYQVEYALMYWNSGDLKSVLSLSLPNLVCSFGTLALLYADRNKMQLSYLLWALVYFAISIGATWLLSGPRYLAMVFPLALAIRRICKTTFSEVLMEIGLLVAQTAYLLMLALDMYVY